MGGFMQFVAPLVDEGRNAVRAQLSDLECDALSPMIAPPDEMLLPTLFRRLSALVSRSLVLEVNVQRLQGLLPGGTPEERFNTFVGQLSRPLVALDLWAEYPVMARQAMLIVDQWVASSVAFVQRLSNDWSSILTALSAPEGRTPHVVVEVASGLGDPHRGGREVLIVRTQHGFRAVYKPRPLAVEVHFQELLRWVNDQGFEPAFRPEAVVNKGSYGWVAFAAHIPCEDHSQVGRFYERQGANLALLHVLGATDMHSENVIACGENPVLVDLEALFHPNFDVANESPHVELVRRSMHSSVMRVGLLPQRLVIVNDDAGVDLSGLGGTSDQLTPVEVPHLDDVGTDAVRLVYRRSVMPESQNRPRLGDDDIRPSGYTEEIERGFTAMYRLLMDRRDALVDSEGPVGSFAYDEVRVLLRPTRAYGLLLQKSHHPDVLRDALDRERLLDRLWNDVPDRPSLEAAIAAERASLSREDIPYFCTRPAARDVVDDTDQTVSGLDHEPTLTAVFDRIARLDGADLTRQRWFVRATLTPATSGARPYPAGAVAEHEIPTGSRAHLVDAAAQVGDYLEALAYRESGRAIWAGRNEAPPRAGTITALGPNLYDGLAGISTFLAYLGELSGEPRYASLAREAVTTMIDQLVQYKSVLTAVGGFTGWGGIIHALVHLGTLWGDEQLLDIAEGIVADLPARVDQDGHLDVVSGSAGCIASLLSLHAVRPLGSALLVAIQCGERLLATGQQFPVGTAWKTSAVPTEALAGFAHGAAGFAWALSRLAEATGCDAYTSAAAAAVDYERTLHVEGEGNWRDLRPVTAPGDPARRPMTAWCHGAPGIGLARLCSASLLDATTTREVTEALSTTMAAPEGINHSLCHGDLGNLDLLLQYTERYDDEAVRRRAWGTAQRIAQAVRGSDWRCGDPVETPGLMTGLSGIGYGLLRVAAPELAPSVLTLAPPARR